MARVNNPFIVTGKIEAEYFCDRVSESARVIKTITNGNNLVIISPRRMGKTGLIQFCYDKPQIAEEYYTFFIDILHTTSLREFTYLLGRTIYDTLLPRSRKMASLFIQTIKSINGKFGFDPITNMPTFNVELGDIERPEYTLDEIFRYLAEADKPCIVAIDEFQQIAKYPEKNIEALLRTHIQKLGNCNFIFAGSERHMMQEMFTSSARPFYNSADLLELRAIAPGIYIPFVCGHFEKRNRSIAPENVEGVYRLSSAPSTRLLPTHRRVRSVHERLSRRLSKIWWHRTTLSSERFCRTFQRSRRLCSTPLPKMMRREE